MTTGVLHFTTPDTFTAIVPEYLPAPEALVYASGAAEIAGGLGVLSATTARWAGWWLIATLVAVFPANVDMALHAQRHPDLPPALLWARLPLQAALIGWVHWAAIRRHPRGRPGRRRGGAYAWLRGSSG